MNILTVRQRIDQQTKALNELTQELRLAASDEKKLDEVYKNSTKYDNDWFFIDFSKTKVSKQNDTTIEITYEINSPTLWATRDDSVNPEERKQLELSEFFKTTKDFPGKMLHETYGDYGPGMTYFRGNGETYQDSPISVCVVQFPIQ